MAIRLFKKDPCKDAYPDDGALIHGILKNENRALKCIYEQSFPQIRQFVTQNHGSEQDAEDIFQEAMMAIWQNVKTGKYEKKQNVKLNTYVFQVSKYRWFENLKSARVKYNVRLNPEFDQAHEDTMENLFTESKKLEYLAKIFDQLGEKCQRLLSLYYYQKMSIASIAEQVGYTPKSAKNEKYRCMQKLKALHQKNNKSHENF